VQREITKDRQEETEAAEPSAGGLALAGWALFDWASKPFYVLITTFLFGPYFINTLIGDPIQGQSLWGYTNAAAGVLVGLLGPALGAAADAVGRQKLWLAVISAVFVVSQWALWLAVPGQPGVVPLIVAVFIVATLAAELAVVLNNTMMLTLVPRTALGRLSGIGRAVGYSGGLLSLIIITNVSFNFSLPNPLGGEALFTVDAAGPNHDQQRFVGPFCAIWYVLFVLPMFLFTPDAPGRSGAPVAAMKEAMRTLKDTFDNLHQYRDIALFLLASLLYMDALAAIFSFGGIYAASIFGWSAPQIGLFAIILIMVGALSAFLGGFLDDLFGARAVIVVSLALLILGALGALSVSRDAVLFAVPAAPPVPAGPQFSSVNEQVYLGFCLLIGASMGPLQTASRSLMARLSPPDRISEFFGLFAFSNRATAFAAQLAVGGATQLLSDQRLGISVLLGFLLPGLWLMLKVKEPRG
jgi:UMF1 family MFS transporter